jgi:trans-aconitate 2-methyltransferase
MIKNEQHYTFGDGELAARRLALLASVFQPISSRLLRGLTLPSEARDLGLDLGCGPGYTSELVATSLPLVRVIGLDQSQRLLAQATAERSSARVSFARCDVSKSPFPVPAAQLLYSRFLLTHLREPTSVIRSWAAAAAPGALLVLEETASMIGEHPAFSRYYSLVERMQAHYGQRMYIGRQLEALSACPEWIVEHAEITRARLPAADMARLHFFNLLTWSKDAFARENYAPDELNALGVELEKIANGEIEAPAVTLGMGQAILRRRD